MRTLKQKVDIEMKDACVGWRFEGVKNRHPSSESASKMRTLRQKVDVDVRFLMKGRIFDAFFVDGVAFLAPQSDRRLGGSRVFVETCVFSLVFTQNRAAHSPKRKKCFYLTHRLRVVGFCVPGRLWEAQFVVFFVSGRL